MQIILLPVPLSALGERDRGHPPTARRTGNSSPGIGLARLAQYEEFRAGTRPRSGLEGLRIPPAAGRASARTAMGALRAWLWDRYADRIAAFEVVNEPNWQLWPQRTTVETDDFEARWDMDGTRPVGAPAVAEMMSTVDTIAPRAPERPLLLAPSTSDSDIDTVPRYTTISHTNEYANPPTRSWSRCSTSCPRGFDADDRWVWSYHNYSDVERDRRHGVDLRRVLVERGWAGRQLDGGPEMWCTEGGCRLVGANRVSAPSATELTVDERRDYQAQVLTEALSRHHYAKGAGAGVGMVTQYTTYADPASTAASSTSGGRRRAAAVARRLVRVPEYRRARAARRLAPAVLARGWSAPASSRRERIPSLA